MRDCAHAGRNDLGSAHETQSSRPPCASQSKFVFDRHRGDIVSIDRDRACSNRVHRYGLSGGPAALSLALRKYAESMDERILGLHPDHRPFHCESLGEARGHNRFSETPPKRDEVVGVLTAPSSRAVVATAMIEFIVQPLCFPIPSGCCADAHDPDHLRARLLVAHAWSRATRIGMQPCCLPHQTARKFSAETCQIAAVSRLRLAPTRVNGAHRLPPTSAVVPGRSVEFGFRRGL